MPKYEKIGPFYVKVLEENILDCLSRWAFLDAFATIYEQRRKIALENFLTKNYWRRIPRTDVRVGQVVGYALKKFNEVAGKKIFPEHTSRLENDFIRETIDEAVAKVMEFA